MRRTNWAVRRTAPARIPVAIAIAIATAVTVTARGVFAFSDQLFVVTSDYMTTGNTAALQLEPPWSASINVETVCSDPIVRHFGGLHYVVNRFLCDNIQVIDPESFTTIREFSVGPGSNPNDILVVDEETAYVTLYETTSLHEIDPSTGDVRLAIDLGSFADADGIPEMSMMALDGTHLFIQIQRLDRSQLYMPVAPSYLAVLDITAGTLVDTDAATPGVQGITLTGLNPTGKMHVDAAARRLYVGEVGRYGQTDGGIDVIDLDALAATGFATRETQLEGDVGSFAIASEELGYALRSTDGFFNTDLVSFSLSTGELLDEHYSTPAYASGLVFDGETSQLFLADHRTAAPGIHVFDAATGERLTAAAISVGLLPIDMVAVHGTSPSPCPCASRPAVSVIPNPFRTEARISLEASSADRVTVTLHDLQGRHVRTIASRASVDAGPHEWTWNGRDEGGQALPAGVYLYRISGWRMEHTGRVVMTR